MLFEGLLDDAAALQGQLPRGALFIAALALRFLHRRMPGHVLEIADLRPDLFGRSIDFDGLDEFLTAGAVRHRKRWECEECGRNKGARSSET